ncbi:Calx-beta domain-containing protein [Novosphingobium sp.]|uniref:Calx-beta domain-containing protein n=2 Tax=unclassified Novosphingobium TaxID=2644732 RepID=UPI002CD10ADF|nr:Calx-beta domain-containing protein [Novosphingobium sp.]HQV03003.1 Calx-beta domain-containing protein [Novosphingobium sp.]
MAKFLINGLRSGAGAWKQNLFADPFVGAGAPFEVSPMRGFAKSFNLGLDEGLDAFSFSPLGRLALGGASSAGTGFDAADRGSVDTDTAFAPVVGDGAPIPDAIQTGGGAIALTALDVASTQNFDTLAQIGTSSALPSGWYFDETSTSSPGNTLYTGGTGGSTSGDTYSFGAAGSADRAFGQLRSGSNVVTLGAQFTNNTGSSIGSFDIAYTGEQWRLGALGRADTMTFQISFDATSLTTGTWTNVSQLTFTAPTTAGTVGALDGNATANRSALSSTVTLAQAIASGQTFWIRWVDTDASGSDDGLAIDDFSITPHAAAPSAGTLSINDVTQTEGNSGTINYVFTVTRSGGSAGAISADWSLANGTTNSADFGTFPQSGTINFADGQTTATITITVAGDSTFEPNEAFFVNLTNLTGGATLSDGQGQGTITNDDAAPVAQLSINDVTQTEGNSGTTSLVFTVTRGGDTSGAASATWTVVNGTTDAADFTGLLTGTVNFAAGELTQTITVQVTGDTTVEPNETFSVVLSNPGANTTITDNTGAGSITNDDVPPQANVFFNEFHYDNSSTDVGERIEVAGLAGTDLTGWTIVLYNGGNGQSYATINLSGTISDQDDGFGTLSFNAVGMQNGAPDGFALVDNFGRVIQFLSYEGTMTATNGPANGLTSTDVGVAEEPAPGAGFSLQLIGTGSGTGDFTWTGARTDNFGLVNTDQDFLGGNAQGQFRISDAVVTEGNSGTSLLTFTVSRAGGFNSTATVDWNLNLLGAGTTFANAADLAGGGTQGGTLTFAAGQFSQTVTIVVNGDVAPEFNETLQVVLSNVTGNAALSDATGVGTINNDDPITLAIHDIQGAGHTSSYVGQNVTTTGIVTFLAANGFYLQAADADADANAATSEAIFVFTSTAPTVAIGDAISVAGVVSEFVASATSLGITQLITPVISVLSSGNALPTAVLIGTGGLLPPTGVIDNDGLTSFDPSTDGIDFYEALEGMRVTIDTPTVVASTNSFGETYVVASGGAGATGMALNGTGITISSGDANPERIQIDSINAVTTSYGSGDRLASVTGVLGYSFNEYELLTSSDAAVTAPGTLARETTTLVGNADHLTIAIYNVENLDPSDNRYTILANDIIFNLGAPDILALQEIQDDNGTGTGTVSAIQNLTNLVNALNALDSTANYVFAQIDPSGENTTGGEPNGNIRNAFVYDANRVSLLSGSLALISDPAFANSRSPLVGTFVFNGNELTLINVHQTSRGGSDPDFGANQPPAIAGDDRRIAQADAVVNYINNNLATDPLGRYAVMGDFNGFYWENGLTHLTNNVTGGLVNLSVELLDPSERYTYQFLGNLQQLDHLLTSPGLLTGAQYDLVHINAQFATGASDHDPHVARLYLPALPDAINDGTSGLETQTFNGNVLTNDLNGANAVTAVNGQAISVGQQITLASGALLTLNANGTFAYDPNGAFMLVGAASGAANTQATDSFTYRVNGGDTATVTVTINGVTQGGDTFLGNSQVNVITATALNDTINVTQGGADTVNAGDGVDFVMIGTGNNGSTLNGEGGTDTLSVSGTVGSLAGLTGFERVLLNGGASLTLAGDQFATGLAPTSLLGGSGTIIVNMTAGTNFLATPMIVESGASVAFTINGSSATDVVKAALDATNTIFGGDGADQIRGGNLADTIDGGIGDDKIIGLSGADQLTGGAGADQFRYFFAADSGVGAGNRDVILDFNAGEDKLDFRILDADPNLAGRQTLSFIGTGAFTAGGSGEARYAVSGADLLVQIDLDGNGTTDMEMLLQGAGSQMLTGTDFLF